MNIGIIVFAYNRDQHLKKMLDGLCKKFDNIWNLP